MIAAKQMRATDARIAVAALQPVVAEIFAISRFDRVLDIVSVGAGARSNSSRPRRSKLSTRPRARRQHEADSLLGHARLAAGCADRGGGARKAGRGAARRIGPRFRVGRGDRGIRRRPRFPVAGTYGGHTSCVEIETGGPEYVLCDLGSGVRPFGQAALARHGPGSPQTYHIFMSHVHWDHIMGLPFFTPAYIPGNRVCIYGGHAGLEAALRRQQEQPSFPVDFSTLRADIEFVHLEPGQALRHRRHDGHHEAAAPRRRFLRLSLRGGRPGGRLLDRFRAQARGSRGDRRASSSSFATPTS